MNTSSHDLESTPLDNAAARVSGLSIHQRVANLALGAPDRSEFLKLLAADLCSGFRAAVVAVHSSHWSRPMMLVVDEPIAQAIPSDSIRELLASATEMPVAFDLALDGSANGHSVRGVRVQLAAEPQRCAILVIYAHGQTPASAQVEDLKRLSHYAEAARQFVPPLPVAPTTDALPTNAVQTNTPLANPTSTAREHQASSPTNAVSSPTASDAPSEPSAPLSRFHLDLDLDATCYRIANESRRLLKCDRTTILVPQSGKFRVKAVSGVAVVNTRSNSVRAVERLTQAASVMSGPLRFPSEEQMPPQIQTPLDEYLDESGASSALLLPLYAPLSGDAEPLHDDGELIGVMVLENFSGHFGDQLDPRCAPITQEAALSLRNALEHNRVFGLRLWKAIGDLVASRRMPMVVAAAALAVCLLLASMIIQVEHYVVATGNIEPTARREVYAGVDGIVKKLHVHDGQSVNAGDVLLELENAELENRGEELSGAIQTATRRLAAIQAIRVNRNSDSSQSRQLALEQRQLECELSNLRAQQEVVREQQQQLKVTSPIDGIVIGWQLERQLADRPVSRGNLLVSVADPGESWSLRLQIPDRDAAPVLASARDDSELPIEFAIATQPEAFLSAKLRSLATAARVDHLGERVIDAEADVTQSDGRALCVGADVTAKIACGNRSVLRSWFGDVFAFVHRNILFYF